MLWHRGRHTLAFTHWHSMRFLWGLAWHTRWHSYTGHSHTAIHTLAIHTLAFNEVPMGIGMAHTLAFNKVPTGIGMVHTLAFKEGVLGIGMVHTLAFTHWHSKRLDCLAMKGF